MNRKTPQLQEYKSAVQVPLQEGFFRFDKHGRTDLFGFKIAFKILLSTDSCPPRPGYGLTCLAQLSTSFQAKCRC